MIDKNITKDALYGAVAPDDFESMIEVTRYAARSDAFDQIIAATHLHFWDPLDKKYIDFDEPFDMTSVAMLPIENDPILRLPYVAEKLSDPLEKIRFINHLEMWNFSSILHGEQGALNLSASLCHVLKDQGAQEYAANQAREEARHVTAFAKYVQSRWGQATPCSTALKSLLIEIIGSPEVYKKIVGMQILVEGLAMGTFARGYRFNRDPVARRLFQLVMTDENFHHKFGKIWAMRTVSQLTEAERNVIEDWAAHCAQSLMFNTRSPEQQQVIYGAFGLEADMVLADMVARRKQRDPNKRYSSETNIFRVLVNTLLQANLITDRTRKFYAAYVDMDELQQGDGRTIGDDIADEGIRYLEAINFKERSEEGRAKLPN